MKEKCCSNCTCSSDCFKSGCRCQCECDTCCCMSDNCCIN